MDQTNIESLKREFSGKVILPGNADYEKASTTFIYKGAPAIVLEPHTTEDIAAAIKFARNNSLTLSVRGGGHSNAGFSTNTGGLVIDLRKMNKVEIADAYNHTVRIGGGATWGEVAKALQEHGLALSSGDTASVGVGGLTLGGGIGWMVRKYGLAIDSLKAAEVVTASGEVLRASATEHPDLFWAIRGGGGNFGIVAYFEFEAHPQGKVFSGTITYGLDNLPELLKGWRDHMRTADENLTTIINILPSFGGNPPGLRMACCYAADNEPAAMEAINPLKQLGGGMLNESIKEKPYADVLEEAHPPAGIKVIVQNMVAKNFSNELIAAVSTACTVEGSIVQIRSLGGAMNRVAADATAFPHRDSEVLLALPVFVPPGLSEAGLQKALNPWHTISSFGSGSYINFNSEISLSAAALYPESTYRRLAKIKKTYDPNNIFNQNYNIKVQ